ncbi:MAG: PQQ-binding-like beta-propeller repeat protein [Ardenticatenaceae bacterium]|nr:PQQ-binding-like beta-propeller repeat protein [Ardenticatenaceae bacterium]
MLSSQNFQPSVKRLRWFVLLILILFLTACSVTGVSESWPGITAEGSRVYVSNANQVVAIDGQSGEQVWQYNGQAASENFYAPPLVEDGRVVLGDFGVSGGIFAGGRLLVKIHALVDGDQSPPQVDWIAEDQVSGRIFASALQVDDRIFLGTGDNKFVALDAATGEKIWEFATGNSVWDKPIHVDGILYFTSLDKNVYALAAEDGDLVWSASVSGASAGSPVLNESADLLYVGSFSGELLALNRADGSLAWEAPAEDWVWGTPLYHDGIVYYSDLSGNIYAVDGESGESVWNNSPEVPGSVESEILLIDDQLFVTSGDVDTGTGAITAFNLEGQELWQKDVDAEVQPPPVSMDGDPVIAFVPEDEPLQVVRYDAENGAILWRFTPPIEDEE